MSRKMLIDATQPEETRVAVIEGNRLEEFDFELADRKQLRGNVYLAKVTRVEASLQAAFLEYGGGRHGFLPFSEIHPDYYNIPVSDRSELNALLAEADRHPEDEDTEAEHLEDEDTQAEHPEDEDTEAEHLEDQPSEGSMPLAAGGETSAAQVSLEAKAQTLQDEDVTDEADADIDDRRAAKGVDEVGGDDLGHGRRRKILRRFMRAKNYRIQEVIKARQILLVQVSKEERGNKGAALTTNISLPGRYCVLMPNTARGGGVSRKITNVKDRKRLKSFIDDLTVPDGMSLILRTAGIERSKAEIKRDYSYLTKLWDDIRQKTLNSIAPALIHEESNLINRSIRDLYRGDTGEIIVAGVAAHKVAKSFMKALVPSHVRKVNLWEDGGDLFRSFNVDRQIEAVNSREVKLKSGGYLVIDQTEAMIAIDVNSGRATRQRNIEDTALKANLEAAEETARQMRLRDLAGLIVIDFIDMDVHANDIAVEKRLKEALKTDRARIQVGRIGPFGLLELSRQRMRPNLIESKHSKCPTCGGLGLVLNAGAASLLVMRALQAELETTRTDKITVRTTADLALHILNTKRQTLCELEVESGVEIAFISDPTLVGTEFDISSESPSRNHHQGDAKRRGKRHKGEKAEAKQGELASTDSALGEGADETESTTQEPPRSKRRRRKRGGDSDTSTTAQAETAQTEAAQTETAQAETAQADTPASQSAEQSPETSIEDGSQGSDTPHKPRARRGRKRPGSKGKDETQSSQSASAASKPSEGSESGHTAEVLQPQSTSSKPEDSSPVQDDKTSKDTRNESSVPLNVVEIGSEKTEVPKKSKGGWWSRFSS